MAVFVLVCRGDLHSLLNWTGLIRYRTSGACKTLFPYAKDSSKLNGASHLVIILCNFNSVGKLLQLRGTYLNRLYVARQPSGGNLSPHWSRDNFVFGFSLHFYAVEKNLHRQHRTTLPTSPVRDVYCCSFCEFQLGNSNYLDNFKRPNYQMKFGWDKKSPSSLIINI